MRVPEYLPAVAVVVGGLLAHVAQARRQGWHVSVLSRGCGKAASAQVRPDGDPKELTMQSPAGGGERRFLLHLPVGYPLTHPSSLILSFHGKGQTPFEMENETQMSNSEFDSHATVVYPAGIKKQWSGDPEAPPLGEVNDIEFVNDLLDYLEENYCFDTRRVYASGFSNGGGLTALLACDGNASSRIAAFAIASGAFYRDSALKEPLFGHCNPARSPVPIMEIHGEKDPVIHYDGKTTPDGETYSLPEWLKGWATRNGCAPDVLEQTASLYDDNVVRFIWACKTHEEVVVHYYINGFGHGWPTTTPLDNDYQRYGPTYFNATPIVLDFFSSHALPLGPAATGGKDEL
ncbi:hypothetical protein MMC30_008187 [Trapelia coarctata]|nr:hypothetical protein [Trapelia coarctata]